MVPRVRRGAKDGGRAVEADIGGGGTHTAAHSGRGTPAHPRAASFSFDCSACETHISCYIDETQLDTPKLAHTRTHAADTPKPAGPPTLIGRGRARKRNTRRVFLFQVDELYGFGATAVFHNSEAETPNEYGCHFRGTILETLPRHYLTLLGRRLPRSETVG